VNKYRPVGWRGESHRHYLASKGIKTGRYMAYKGFNKSQKERIKKIVESDPVLAKSVLKARNIKFDTNGADDVFGRVERNEKDILIHPNLLKRSDDDVSEVLKHEAVHVDLDARFPDTDDEYEQLIDDAKEFTWLFAAESADRGKKIPAKDLPKVSLLAKDALDPDEHVAFRTAGIDGGRFKKDVEGVERFFKRMKKDLRSDDEVKRNRAKAAIAISRRFEDRKRKLEKQLKVSSEPEDVWE